MLDLKKTKQHLVISTVSLNVTKFQVSDDHEMHLEVAASRKKKCWNMP